MMALSRILFFSGSISINKYIDITPVNLSPTTEKIKKLVKNVKTLNKTQNVDPVDMKL